MIGPSSRILPTPLTILDSPPSLPLGAPPYTRITLRDLVNIAEWQDEIPWKPFQRGVEIHRLYGDGITGPSAALIRFREAGRVPAHEHLGYEHIFVLVGSQRDDSGTTATGSLVVSPPGTQHQVISEAGCIVLAIYEKPVRFLQD